MSSAQLLWWSLVSGVASLLLVTGGMAEDKVAPAPSTGARAALETKNGMAVFYDRSLNGTKTSDGGRLDNAKMTAAHSTYPFGTLIRVTRVKNGKSVEVRVTDHLPATKTNRKLGIIIDLTRTAASKLDMINAGRSKVTLEVLEWGTKKQQ